MAEQQDESADPDSKQYKINHQDWRKSKAPTPGLENDKPTKGRGRGWRSRVRDSPSPGLMNTARDKDEGSPDTRIGGDDHKKRESDTRNERRNKGTRRADARREYRGDGSEAEKSEAAERRNLERRKLEDRRREDERQWEEDKGWKMDYMKKKTPRRVKADDAGYDGKSEVERKIQERSKVEDRRRVDERSWEEDRGWKRDKVKKDNPRRLKADNKEDAENSSATVRKNQERKKLEERRKEDEMRWEEEGGSKRDTVKKDNPRRLKADNIEDAEKNAATERRNHERRKLEERRKEDEKKWEEDRGWKTEPPMRSKDDDTKEAVSTEKSRKQRRAAQQVYVPKARRQAQELYVPHAKRAGMDRETKTRSSSPDKDNKKSNMTKEPPQKRRMVEGGEKQRQRSSNHERRDMECRSSGNGTAELKHKSEKSTDVRDEERKTVSRSKQSRTGEPRIEGNHGSGAQVQSSQTLPYQSLYQASEHIEKKDEDGNDDLSERNRRVDNETMSSDSTHHHENERLTSENDNITREGCIPDQVRPEDDALHSDDTVQRSHMAEDDHDFGRMSPVASMEYITQNDNSVHNEARGNKVDIISAGAMQDVSSDSLDTGEVQMQSNESITQDGVDVFEGEQLPVCNDSVSVHDDIIDLDSEIAVKSSTQESHGFQETHDDDGIDAPGRTIDLGVNQAVSRTNAETCEESCRTDVSSPDNNLIPHTQARQSDLDKMREEMESLNSSQEKEENDEEVESELMEKDDKVGKVMEKMEEERTEEETATSVGVIEASVSDNQMETNTEGADRSTTPGKSYSGLPQENLVDRTTEPIEPSSSGLNDDGGIDTTVVESSDASMDEQLIAKNSSGVNDDEGIGTSVVESSDASMDEQLIAKDTPVADTKNDLDGEIVNDVLKEPSQLLVDYHDTARTAKSDSDVNTDPTELTIAVDSAISSKGEVPSSLGVESSKSLEIEECALEEDEKKRGCDDALPEEINKEKQRELTSSCEEEAVAMESEEQRDEDDDDGDEDDDDDDEDSWDALFDESGKCLKPEEEEELAAGIGRVSVTVKKAKRDYYNYQPKDNMDYSAFDHVIEVYDFPAEFKTPDLIMSFSDFKNKGFDIKWVDDTHALIIFATGFIAQDALSLQNPMFRTRPMERATRESKMKAKRCIEFLQPYKSRPETTATAARRLVSGALGLRSKETKEQRAVERQKLRDAKDKKKADKKQTQDIWEGNV